MDTKNIKLWNLLRENGHWNLCDIISNNTLFLWKNGLVMPTTALGNYYLSCTHQSRRWWMWWDGNNAFPFGSEIPFPCKRAMKFQSIYIVHGRQANNVIYGGIILAWSRKTWAFVGRAAVIFMGAYLNNTPSSGLIKWLPVKWFVRTPRRC